VDEPGVPQYAATIRRWNLKPAFGDEIFRFEPPEGATRIELQSALEEKEKGQAAGAPSDGASAPKQEGRR
jgi:hypothetical protein